MRCALYARVSTTDHHPDNQLAELHRYSAARGWSNPVYERCSCESRSLVTLARRWANAGSEGRSLPIL